jgi:hypothetical protein
MAAMPLGLAHVNPGDLPTWLGVVAASVTTMFVFLQPRHLRRHPAGLPHKPDHAKLDYRHSRIIRHSTWVTAATGLDFPPTVQVRRIRRDGYDITGALISKEIVHAVTSPDAQRAASPSEIGLITRRPCSRLFEHKRLT